MRIRLHLPEDANAATQARLKYAFRLFCAIYGHHPIDQAFTASTPDVVLRYPCTNKADIRRDAPVVTLCRSYRARDPRIPAPPPLPYSADGVTTVLHFAPEGGNAPDWLGEIFEWVSCADEYSVTQRDGVDRPMFSATYAGRHHLDITIPYAAVAMRCLQREICRAVPRTPEEPQRPPSAAHLVVPTHDVDYFPAGRLHAANRLGRNAVISSLVTRQNALALRQMQMAALVALGLSSDPLDCITALAQGETWRGFRSSYNFIPRDIHHRDAQYTLDSPGVAKTMRWLESQGMEIGIHSSYTCHDHSDGLARELSCFHAHGFYPQGGRQHWLRLTLDRFIPAAERAGISYDTSIGYSETVGFRAGACFAFPPYNFQEERAATFLEIPLAMMDQAFPMQQQAPERAFEVASALLAQSRRLGWGGISLLWHPPALGEGWLQSEVGELYWRLADGRTSWGDEWISPQEFVASVRRRYVEAKLLPAQEPASLDAIPLGESATGAMEINLAILQKQHLDPTGKLPQI